MIHETNRQRRAFTMIELMVVLVALSVLVAMVVGLGINMADEQNRTKTKDNQKIVIGAIELYAQVKRDYPQQLHYCLSAVVEGNLVYCHDPAMNDTTPGYGTYPHSNPFYRMMSLTIGLGELPECIDAYSRSDCFTLDQNYAGISVIGTFRDAYGRCLDWDRDGGFGGSPAIISAGPDSYFGHYIPGATPTNIEESEGGPTPPENRIFINSTGYSYQSFQLEAQEDNIRSDDRTRG